MYKWKSVKDSLPDEGTLYICYFPIAENRLTGQTIGPSAMAYYRPGTGWVYADEPTPLRFKPYYWMEAVFPELPRNTNAPHNNGDEGQSFR